MDGTYAAAMPKAIQGFDNPSLAYYLISFFRENRSRSVTCIAPDLKSGLELKQNCEFFLGDQAEKTLLWFPPHEEFPYTGLIGGSDTVAQRLATLKRLTDQERFLLIVPWEAFLRGVIPPGILKKNQWTLCCGEEFKRETLVQWLGERGYQQEVVVESPGDFAVRGALVDIFSPQVSYPSRLEFDGDQLLAIRLFDPATQTSLKGESQQSLTLIPAMEVLFQEETIQQATRQLRHFADRLDLPAPLRREVTEKLQRKIAFQGVETFLPAFYPEPASLFDYFRADTVLFLPDSELLADEKKRFEEEVKTLFGKTSSVEKLIPPDVLLNRWDDLQRKLVAFESICWNPLFHKGEPEVSIQKVAIEGSASLKKQWRPEQIGVWKKEGLEIHLVCHTPIQAERLQDLLRGQGVAHPQIEIGKLSHGFCWPEKKVLYLTEEEIFGHKAIRRAKSSKSVASFTSFAELREGDLLVHEEYGINRYLGLKHLKVAGIVGDYLQLEFSGGDKVYLPVYRLHIIQKYIGASSEDVLLDVLGGLRWKRLKDRVKKEIYKIASELLKIHAQREVHPGTSFPAKDTLDEDFASHFPFDETPDQEKAIEDAFKDMQELKPMDRLICGDVGYGKTEVAMRAAFKAVNSGKQVAFLVPTTVLALQHFETFQERFSPLAVSIEMVSRFRTAAQQKEILQKLKSGKLDIVIGTHRLLGRDVQFQSLGLLILDEEHRFGVRHKERIKKLRPTVDVLTLSATPIPRTLQMSLIGLKDLSIIQTPPVDRLAIRTFIAKWDEGIVHHAIEKELARGGQIFFVHNRVATIESVFQRLKKMFPEAKIAVGHGQMPERDLEKVMIDFLHRRTDILLSTTIIESGIDVPNANTMLINRADTFGLAQLYQLRGRVGRSDRQAYCYLLVPEDLSLTREAKERLEVLTRYTELGAGFQIAAHDLEIRGAGNLLGTSQSGFVEEVGYEMYTKLLHRAIRQLKGETLEEEIDPEIHLNIPAFIPESYVHESKLRMELYKRMSHISTSQELVSFREELNDRFGILPIEVENLLAIIEMKLFAMILRLRSFRFDGVSFAIEWDSSTPVSTETLVALVQRQPKQYQINPSGLLRVRVEQKETEATVAALAKKTLRMLQEVAKLPSP